MTKPELPGYVLTVITRDLLDRRARWKSERAHGRQRAELGPWTPTSADDRRIGLLVSVDGYGEIARDVPCDTPQGIIAVEDGYLIARHQVIELWSAGLTYKRDFASYPWFNDLHSIRASENGMVIAASGTDSITEVSVTGEMRWLWWGAEHGFDTDTFGIRREISKLDDHREVVYDTWLQATHVNSALALGPDMVLATLFHQGCLVGIDRRTGEARPLLPGLGRPHAVRFRSGRLTLADTLNGSGIVARVAGLEGHAADCEVEVDRHIQVPTKWLQDWHALPDGTFVAVDGERPSVLFLDPAGQIIRRDEFDPNWYLYEVALTSYFPLA